MVRVGRSQKIEKRHLDSFVIMGTEKRRRKTKYMFIIMSIISYITFLHVLNQLDLFSKKKTNFQFHISAATVLMVSKAL